MSEDANDDWSGGPGERYEDELRAILGADLSDTRRLARLAFLHLDMLQGTLVGFLPDKDPDGSLAVALIAILQGVRSRYPVIWQRLLPALKAMAREVKP